MTMVMMMMKVSFMGTFRNSNGQNCKKKTINIDGCDQRLTVTSLQFDDGIKDSCLGFGSLLVQSSWPNDFWTNIFLAKKNSKGWEICLFGSGVFNLPNLLSL